MRIGVVPYMQSKRLDSLPPYLFVEIDRLKKSFEESNRQVLDLGIGDPDMGPPPELIDALVRALSRPEHHRYPPDRGLPVLIEAVRIWAELHHGTSLDESEILVTIGSKEAIAHLPLAVVDPGDTVILPDPGYPVYNSSAAFAGARVRRFTLRASNGFLPDFARIERRGAKLIYLNYPNNPTSAMSGRALFSDACAFCSEGGIVLVNDAAYSEITYDRRFEPLFPVAREKAIPYIEFFSFSKTFSITGWRVGFAIGSPEVIDALARIKTNIDSGAFGAIQEAVAVMMTDHFVPASERVRRVYGERKALLTKSLERTKLEFTPPEATFYFWIRTPDGRGSIEFCKILLEETGIVATPGVGFGEKGEGYFRLSLTADTNTVREAGRRLEKYLPRLDDA
jgi:LL-diaminopimelate aminotransferase